MQRDINGEETLIEIKYKRQDLAKFAVVARLFTQNLMSRNTRYGCQLRSDSVPADVYVPTK